MYNVSKNISDSRVTFTPKSVTECSTKQTLHMTCYYDSTSLCSPHTARSSYQVHTLMYACVSFYIHGLL